MTPSLNGVRLLEIPRHEDERGWFLPAFAERHHRESGIDHAWAEMNISHSPPGVICGLHFQQAQAQAKTISVLAGAIWDGVAHGPATIAYPMGTACAPAHEHVLAWDDPVLSSRDRDGRCLAALLKEGTLPALSFP